MGTSPSLQEQVDKTAFISGLFAQVDRAPDGLTRLFLRVAVGLALLARWAFGWLLPLAAWAISSVLCAAAITAVGGSTKLAVVLTIFLSWLPLIPLALLWEKLTGSAFLPD